MIMVLREVTLPMQQLQVTLQKSACQTRENSVENSTSPKSSKSRHPNSSVQFQIKPKSQFEFVPRDIKESEFLG